MTSDEKSTIVAGGGGLGLGSILSIVFTVLKLCGVIAWKWAWVLAPLWISASLWIVILVGIGVLVWWLTKG